METKKLILVTGSSGYVGTNLVKALRRKNFVIGVDLQESPNTDYICDIGSQKLFDILDQIKFTELIIINLAAARFDFGATASEYFNKNVSASQKFLKNLNSFNIKRFIHISSVASIDGESISYSKSLNCDDAYRVTKFLQEKEIISWCKENDVDYNSLLPSAIFSSNERSDTNIGKLQTFLRFLPFIPEINTRKSLTYMENLIDFIEKSIHGKFISGRYMTIEKPVLSVTQIIGLLSKRKLIILNIPFLKIFLNIASYILFVLGGFGRIDLKLTPNRVEKIFKETSYENEDYEDINVTSYSEEAEED